MESKTKTFIMGAVAVVIVAALGIGLFTSASDEGSDGGFIPNPPVTGDWHYTALIASNHSHTTFYEGTLHITVDDNEMTLFEKDTIRTLASEMTDKEIELALEEIGKYNTGSNGSVGTYWPPETAPSYIIRNSFDYASDFTYLTEEKDFTDGSRTEECSLFEDDDGVQYWIAESGVIYGVNVPIDNIVQYFVLDGWEYE